MIRSMTGYGRARAERGGLDILAEVRGVNNRYLDCSVKLPRAYLYAEDALKKQVQSCVGRGKVDVFFTVNAVRADECAVTVNEPLARGYIAALRRLGELGGGELDARCRVADLARLPDVLVIAGEEDVQTVTGDLCAVLASALESYNAMRETEGARLAADVLEKLKAVEDLTAQVEQRSPQTVSEYHSRLLSRMREALEAAGAAVDESKLLTEAAIYADKVSVDEETVRIRSHIGQLRDMLKYGGGVGRKADFLLQELNREANTIGSKCSDLAIARSVVELKAVLEKIREQIQNIE